MSTNYQENYSQSSFTDSMDAPFSFSDNYDVNDPATAASSYAKYVSRYHIFPSSFSLYRSALETDKLGFHRLMHNHTLRQLKTAKDTASRRGSDARSSVNSMSTESSMDESS